MFRNGRYVGPWLQSDPPGGGGTPPSPAPAPAPNPEPPKPANPLDGLTPEQQAELDRRMAAARRDGETNGRTAAERAAADKAEADRVRKAQDDEIAKGNFETVKKQLEGERDTATTERDRLKTDLETATTLLKAGIDDKVKALTEVDPDLAKAFPRDADVLAQITWLDDPRTKAVIAKAGTGQVPGGIPRTPNPVRPETEQERVTASANRLAQQGTYTPL